MMLTDEVLTSLRCWGVTSGYGIVLSTTMIAMTEDPMIDEGRLQ
jgi:hypothetical protein